MLVLFETAAGFALFKVLDEGKIEDADDIGNYFDTASGAQKIVSLKEFSKFESTAEAVSAATAIIESKTDSKLTKFLKKHVAEKEKLAVADSKLGGIIKEKLGIKCVHDAAVQELFRGIRSQLNNLIAGMSEQDIKTMALGLSHSLGRYKLKFSPDKVDTMIVQAISLLDDMDKELNIYAMRVKEWYGWHFPELQRVVTDNLAYARVVKLVGPRTNIPNTDLLSILSEEMAAEVKDVAQISMGTEVSEEDIEHVIDLCDQVISISEYREQLFEYLKNRMTAIAPNLTVMVGELVGARLIAHAGNLMNLAKYPASTIQILGAEKALFRSLKTKNATPKYGLIYHASLVGQSQPKNKGKISRVLAAKTALSVRVDALGETEGPTLGIEARAAVEHRLAYLDGQPSVKASSSVRKGQSTPKYDATKNAETPSLPRERTGYTPSADMNLSGKKRKLEEEFTESAPTSTKKDKKKKEESSSESESESEKKKSKKDKKKAKKEESSESESEKKKSSKKSKKSKDSSDESSEDEKKKKKKSKKSKDSSDEDETPKSAKKKSKKSDSDSESEKKKSKKTPSKKKSKKEDSSSDSD